ncbi:4-(cytidine 5'-diphospho)-2-C-methyl-D-erythritol kinase [Gammaproteobacteria bacterium]
MSDSMANRAWPAPAKLNLMLRITGRRPDGYHTLQTVFQFLDHGDYLYFKVRDDEKIIRATELPGVATDQELTIRAARLLQRVSGTRLGAEITLDKRLPLGGGLGGGSSDAATTLVALNHLWQLGFSEDDLAALGLQLGADVPVFVRGRASWAEGIGEILTPVELPEPWYWVVIPDCQVSTKEVFSDPELTRNSTPITMRDFTSGETRNDCVLVVRGRYPKVSEAMDWLGRGARLTGTGACVYASFPTAEEARVVRLPSGCQAFLARGRNRSPLVDCLRESTGVWPSGKARDFDSRIPRFES